MTITMYDLAGAEADRRFSPFCWRTRMALAHKGPDVETVRWRFTEKDKLPQANAGRVPLIVDNDRIVHDSTVIADYLEERYPDHPSLFGGENATRLRASRRTGPKRYCWRGSSALSSSTSIAIVRRRTRSTSGARAKNASVPPPHERRGRASLKPSPMVLRWSSLLISRRRAPVGYGPTPDPSASTSIASAEPNH
jgi:hypothetical protein